MTIGRRRFLQGLGVAGAAAAAGTLPALAAAQDAGARAEHVIFELPGLDPAHDGLRVAQLSDIHVGPLTSPELVRGAIAEANAFAPDLVVLTGDFVSRSPSDLEDLRALLGGLSSPTVAVLGNHDVVVDPRGTAQVLRAHGYAVLENAWTRLRLRGVPFTVVGVGDHHTGRADVPAAFRGLPAGTSPLVLAHGPKTADRLRALERPLVCLSGHTHGGQINLPVVTPLLLASLREPYARGPYRVGDVRLYVNRGIGTTALGFRIHSPPEVTLATLVPGPPSPRGAGLGRGLRRPDGDAAEAETGG
ncbi:MAG TPA: metallophosphoesterase [Anaeromyxobacter sp.]